MAECRTALCRSTREGGGALRYFFDGGGQGRGRRPSKYRERRDLGSLAVGKDEGSEAHATRKPCRGDRQRATGENDTVHQRSGEMPVGVDVGGASV